MSNDALLQLNKKQDGLYSTICKRSFPKYVLEEQLDTI